MVYKWIHLLAFAGCLQVTFPCTIHNVPENVNEDTCLRREVFHWLGGPAAAHAVPHRGETLCLRGVWQEFHPLCPGEKTQPHALQGGPRDQPRIRDPGAALHLRRIWRRAVQTPGASVFRGSALLWLNAQCRGRQVLIAASIQRRRDSVFQQAPPLCFHLHLPP